MKLDFRRGRSCFDCVAPASPRSHRCSCPTPAARRDPLAAGVAAVAVAVAAEVSTPVIATAAAAAAVVATAVTVAVAAAAAAAAAAASQLSWLEEKSRW